MKANEVKVGGFYTAKVSGVSVVVRLDKIEKPARTVGNAITRYHYTNLRTERKGVFKSAAKLIASVPVCDKCNEPFTKFRGDSPNTCLKCLGDTPKLKHGLVPELKRTSKAQKEPSAPLKKLKEVVSKGVADHGAVVEIPAVSRPEDFTSKVVDTTNRGARVRVEQLEQATEGEQGSDPTSNATTAGSGRSSRSGTGAGRSAKTARNTTPAVKANPRDGLEPYPGEVHRDSSNFSQEMGAAVGSRVVDDSPHLIIEARAGTGKTTTLVEGVKELLGSPSHLTPSPQQRAVWDALLLSKGKISTVGFCAFNRSIAQELKTRVPKGCDAMTMHGLGFRAVNKTFKLLGGDKSVNEYRVNNLMEEKYGVDSYELRRKKGPLFVGAAKELVSLCKINLLGPQSDMDLWNVQEDLDRLVSHFDIDLEGVDRTELYDLVPWLLDRCKAVARDKYIDYDDMIWLPVVLNLPVQKYDVLVVDEAQDLNRCQQALAKRAGNRLVFCGDPRQAIYGFAGADNESMSRLATELDATVRGSQLLPLTVTRRCGKAIVAEAKKIVPDFEAHESNGEGMVTKATYDPRPMNDAGGWRWYFDVAQDGDMVLCRVNAPLVSECFKFIKQGRKANIQGRDIGKGLTTHFKKMAGVIEGSTPSVAPGSKYTLPETVTRLGEWLANETAKEMAKKNPLEAKIIALGDKHDCLLALMDGASSVFEVLARIESIFTDDKTRPGIRLSSIHKAKGLEANRVFLLEPEGATVPHPMAKTPWQIEQEWNLKYVAITRAIQELVYVS